MSFILDALKKTERDKKQRAEDKKCAADTVPQQRQWAGWPSGHKCGCGNLSDRIRSSISPIALPIATIVAFLAVSSAVAWASMVYFNESKNAGVGESDNVNEITFEMARHDIDGGITDFTTAGYDVSPAMPDKAWGRTGPNAFLSDGMDQSEVAGEVQEEQGRETGVEYRAALLEEDAMPATPATNFTADFESSIDAELYAADGILLDGVVYHSLPEKRSAILRRDGEKVGKLVKVGDMFAGLEVAHIHHSNIALKKGINRFVIHMN